jgi:alkylation response protein AidB-like acyl-CoA dehydrogenase
MDFAYGDEGQALIELAAQIFREKAGHAQLRELERLPGPRFDRDLWQALAESGLLGTALPEAHGGAGLGFLELSALLEQAGRAAAPVPLFETLVLGALPIARFAPPGLAARWLPGVACGEVVLTAGLIEARADPRVPVTAARRSGRGWRLRGAKVCVPAAALAARILVPARAGRGEVVIALVDPAAEGVGLTPLLTTSGRPESQLELDGVRVGAEEVIVGPEGGREALEWLIEHAIAAQAAMAVGLCSAALELTAEYVKTRKQFDQPIAMFQAVAHRAADAYIDVEAIRLTALQACWRLSEGLPASAEVALAKFWAAEAGQRVVAAAQHLHGGIGVDREYPLHRYYLHAKELELALGGASAQLVRIGEMLADSPS